MFSKIFNNKWAIALICLCIGASLSLFKKPDIQYKEVIKYTESTSKQTDAEKTASKLTKKLYNCANGALSSEETLEGSHEVLSVSEKKDIKLDKQVDYSSKVKDSSLSLQASILTDSFKTFKPQLGAEYNKGIFFTGGSINPNDLKDWSVQVGIKLEIPSL